MTDSTRYALKTGGRAWGPARVALGISIRRLADLSGVDKAILSMAENGRLIPSGPEYTAVMSVLDGIRADRSKEGAS